MHIILGGAFNGKRQFVKETYRDKPITFFEGEWPDTEALKPNQYVAIGRFEEMLETYEHLSEDEVVYRMVEKLQALAQQSQIICICTDMSRGIVPLEKEKRRQRDVCGRLYQHLCKDAAAVTRIWYSLPQKLK